VPVKTIFIFALFAALITSESLIDPPGLIIIFTLNLSNFEYHQQKEKKHLTRL